MKKTAAVLLISVFGAGCFGNFSLTKKLYDWNKNVAGDKYGKEAVFLACAVLPVYGGAVFVDALILNSIEFWSGKNPSTVKRIEKGEKALVMKFDGEGRLRLDIFRNGKAENAFIVSQNAAGRVETADFKGNSYYAETGPDGKIAVYSADGSALPEQ